MEYDEDLRPKYHINNSVVFLQKSQEQQSPSLSPEPSADNDPIEKQWRNANRHTPIEIATIDNGISNKLKIAVAVIGGCSTMIAAVISAIVTYYASKDC